MFSTRFIRSLVSSSDEQQLKLSEADWKLVLDANRDFKEDPRLWKGNSAWGKYLLGKMGRIGCELDFRDSLELCCGNGFLYFSFRELFDLTSGCRFIDLSRSQCDAFALRCETAGVKAPDILCGDIGDLPLGNGSIRLVYGHSFLHHLPDVGKSLGEVARVLKSGGRFVAFHEPTPTAPFLESFPRSLFKDVEMESLTDIWLIRSEVITRLLKAVGFRHINIIPTGLISSLAVTPWQILLAKMGKPYQKDVVPRMKALCDRLDRLMPGKFRVLYGPSLAIIARK
jgi:ubiquinone/menaquinone biosynthesis C-methylase UbiE